METLSAVPTDAEILLVIERWVDDLAEEKYDGAFARTAHDPYFGWTPPLMRAVIEGYGSPEPHRRGRFAVTARNLAVGESRVQIDRNDIPSGVHALVSYTLPLNGEWSDLTATFRVAVSGSHSELILEEIHVF